VPKTRVLPSDETVRVSLGIQLLNFDSAEGLSDHTWAGAEEVLEEVELPPSSAAALRYLLECGWDSESATGLLLGMWLRKTAPAAEIVRDLLGLDSGHRRVLTALYAAGNGKGITQYSITRDGALAEHSYSRRSLGGLDIKLFAA
jgi:hypothetical protein